MNLGGLVREVGYSWQERSTCKGLEMGQQMTCSGVAV